MICTPTGKPSGVDVGPAFDGLPYFRARVTAAMRGSRRYTAGGS